MSQRDKMDRRETWGAKADIGFITLLLAVAGSPFWLGRLDALIVGALICEGWTLGYLVGHLRPGQRYFFAFFLALLLPLISLGIWIDDAAPLIHAMSFGAGALSKRFLMWKGIGKEPKSRNEGEQT